jgi:hypothetical protein
MASLERPFGACSVSQALPGRDLHCPFGALRSTRDSPPIRVAVGFGAGCRSERNTAEDFGEARRSNRGELFACRKAGRRQLIGDHDQLVLHRCLSEFIKQIPNLIFH